ncbi:DUF1697 domain-containing protein [Leptospira sp. 2 VSF19]|uniref:DUF1697 domain-containing protein n=1 Tax=Leptospira soteropolitanensis TaxID=2950025 RepID=A0AAW5V7M5_9LEPT|nr:DUF1697 domain-containing protein [Leptospira soteropolitanensis]MCW7491399.1 DUF1697 domain-containing protein [Leptospira soteropolitanensis]MCW7498983.1 DUF1697 domain-containing protein [Leptospira soteropolitanensis]MCW7521425.1 DUF1697 domain-containing protein [Leptospira soteropolitanensis]MCW7525087.1 DUF1697 domain-containing protein [Leptospira soteropolitanensis]MCW7528954.1 DUF1697 domain-containing protein [Leptospira soteropolitanensis]
MKYIALLRGINVGGNRKVEMKKLRSLMESLGYTEVSTYINSGNIIFEAEDDTKTVRFKIEKSFEKVFKFEIPTIVKTEKEMKKIANAIPKEWQNDSTQRTDVAYLFPEADSKKIIEELPLKKEFLEIRYQKGALIWNIKRENVNKSQLAKLISHKLYKSMTIRNVNTARFLAGETE